MNAVDKYNDAPLKKAAFRGFSDFVVFLVLKGANVNHKDGSGKIALHHSAEQGQLQSVEVMLDAHADVGSVSSEGFTPLHYAAANGHSWCCKALIVAGAYVDAKGGRGLSTALHLAAEKGHVHTVQVLIAERADINIPDGQNRKPFSVCKGGVGSETYQAFQSPFVKTMCHGPSCTGNQSTLSPDACLCDWKRFACLTLFLELRSAEGPGVHAQARADDACMFLIIPRDRYGVILRDDLGLLNFTVDCEEMASNLIVPAKVIPNSRMGNHVCYFDASKIGKYRIHLYQEDFQNEGEVGNAGRRVPCAGSPYCIDVLPAPMDTYTTRASGPGVSHTQAGCTAVFTVFGRDRFQNPSSQGRLSVVIQPLNRPPAQLEITNDGWGSYLVRYRAPPEAGWYALSVTLDGKRHIYNSPFSVFVHPGPVHASHCSVLGRGVVRGGKNLPMRFHMHSADKLGNALTQGGLQWRVSVHELLRPGEEAGDAQRKVSTAADSDSDGDYSEGDNEEDGEELHSVMTGKAIEVAGLEGEVATVGKPLAVRVWDHRNGSYTCEFHPRRVGRLQIEIALMPRGQGGEGDGEPVRGSPFYPLVNSIPEWDVEDVGLFVERIGFPELARNFVLKHITGQRLCALTEVLLDKELAIDNKSTQRTLMYLINLELKSSLEPDALLSRVDDVSLASLGILEKPKRERIVGFLAQTTEKSFEAMEAEDKFQKELKKRLGTFGNSLQEAIRMVLEDTMSDFTDEILNDWNEGKFKNNFQLVTAEMKRLELELKSKLEHEARLGSILKSRTATLEEQKQGLTDDDVDDTEPLFVPGGQAPGSAAKEESRAPTAGSSGSAIEQRVRAREEREKAKYLAQLAREEAEEEQEAPLMPVESASAAGSLAVDGADAGAASPAPQASSQATVTGVGGAREDAAGRRSTTDSLLRGSGADRPKTGSSVSFSDSAAERAGPAAEGKAVDGTGGGASKGGQGLGTL